MAAMTNVWLMVAQDTHILVLVISVWLDLIWVSRSPGRAWTWQPWWPLGPGLQCVPFSSPRVGSCSRASSRSLPAGTVQEGVKRIPWSCCVTFRMPIQSVGLWQLVNAVSVCQHKLSIYSEIYSTSSNQTVLNVKHHSQSAVTGLKGCETLRRVRSLDDQESRWSRAVSNNASYVRTTTFESVLLERHEKTGSKRVRLVHSRETKWRILALWAAQTLSSVGWLHYFGPDKERSLKNTRKFSTDIHGSQMIFPSTAGVPVTFPLAPPCGFTFLLMVNIYFPLSLKHKA